jgi:methylenetetrahydrofolate dehydrogenase (NADP+)/methenyltetrahydrofolate cyclohydrolase
MATSIDGRALSKELLEQVHAEVTELGVPIIVRALAIAPTPATRSYLRIKERAAVAAGMQLELRELPEESIEAMIIEQIQEPGADAVIVQLPLPVQHDIGRILNAIPLELDADVLSARTRELQTTNVQELVAPVAAAVDEVLARASIDPAGMRVMVIGEGRLVGAPVAARLAQRGARVTTLNEHSFTPTALLDADIIVSGAGVPHLVKPDMIRDGVVLIDAGTSEQKTEHGSAIVGDIDPACAEKARLYTPVPGGIGPLTVACLFRNVLTLVKLRKRNNALH